MDADSLIIMGRFGAPFGVKGEIKVQSFSDPADALLDYEPWYYEHEGHIREIPVKRCRFAPPSVLVTLEGFDDRDKVKVWTHTPILVSRSALPETDEDEYYWSDLEGVSVYTGNGQKLGMIESFINTGAHDIMIVKNKTKTHLIPFVLEHIVKKVDLDGQQLIVDWQEPE